MPQPPTSFDKIVLTAVVLLCLTALALTFLTPGFSLDSALVYQGF